MPAVVVCSIYCIHLYVDVRISALIHPVPQHPAVTRYNMLQVISNGSEEDDTKSLSSFNPLPLLVQIVDFEIRTEGTLLSSYTVYVILTRQEDICSGNDGKGKILSTVRRYMRYLCAVYIHTHARVKLM